MSHDAALVAVCVVAALLAACGGRPGERCQNDADCAPDLACTRAPGGPSSAEGVCAPALAGEGDLCEVTADCRDGLFCDNDVAAEPERYGACTPTRPAGEPCRRDANCQPNLQCAAPAEDALGACSPIVDAGNPLDGTPT